MQRICVYCGSSIGSRPIYAEAASELAEVLVRHDYELVYGGANKGIMGIIADAVLEQGGKVHGIIPKMLCEKEIAHQNLTELHIVSSMHARKTMMAALSDGLIRINPSLPIPVWRSDTARARRLGRSTVSAKQSTYT